MSQQQDKPIALVTGANRGIGFEIARQLGARGAIVLLGARDAARGREATLSLASEGIEAVPIELDVTDAASIAAARALVHERFGRLDVLVNNAGAAFDWTPAPRHPSAADLDVGRRTFELNFFGPLAVTQAFVPLLRNSRAARIVMVSSSLGSLAQLGDPESPLAGIVAPMYQASKTALNALTTLFAKELRDTTIKVNSACPGWVDTDAGVPPWPREAQGGPGAARPVAEGAASVVWLATLPDDGPTGGFFRDRERVPW